ncbi:hypothetical protein [Zavarzinia sp. CC-PAN008]|uniref:hypothetical protein n=1 Tax=Zavarzinia sp. CC-PAN008 TaxID=3243332 RepID=UPI003F743A68
MANIGSRSLKAGRPIRYPGSDDLIGVVAAIMRTTRGVVVRIGPPDGTNLPEVEVAYADAVSLMLTDRPHPR